MVHKSRGGDVLVTFPDSENIRHSPDYHLTVNGEPVFLYEFPGFAGGTVSVGYFDFTGSARVEVKSNWRLDSASVRPLSAGIDAEVDSEARTVSFTMDEPRNIFIKFNDSFMIPLYLFCAPPEEDAPSPGDENVLYFGPGVHNIPMTDLKSGQTVYIAGGAFVNGTFRAIDAENVTVRGRGIICTSHEPFGLHRPGGPMEVIGFVRCKNCAVDGITILDSFGWTLISYNCEDMLIKNVKILNERPWSTDGINPCNCRNFTVDGCFVRSKDDCISIKGLRARDRQCDGRQPIENITVKNCVFWSDNNNGVVVGSETLAEYIRSISFENCDFLKVSGTCGDVAGAMSIISLHDTQISDIIFKDIRVEHTEGPLFNFFYTNSIFRIPGERKPGGGNIRGIKAQNVSLSGGPMRWSYVSGMDADRMIEDVTFENLEIFGKRAGKPEDARIYINRHTKNIIVK